MGNGGKIMRTQCAWGLSFGILILAPVSGAGADDDVWRERTVESVDSALRYLASTQQPDGGWTLRDASDPAITALAVKCFVQSPQYGADHPIARRAFRFILSHTQPDGGIYIPDQGLGNYYTSVCLMALAGADDERHQAAIDGAQSFLRKGQWDDDEGHSVDSVWYGGAGYGSHKRPDLSNTQVMLEALKQSGLPESDPTYKKALVFISRSQMVSEQNDQAFAKGSGDGGFIYTPVNGGESKAGEIDVDGGGARLRTYGSMTYAGFKSLLYAGVSRDDPRVQAALGWIQRHYTLDANPNMPGSQSTQGLYYYYHVFARALDAFGEDAIVDHDGKRHDWRRELCEKLVSLQRRDGSWVNEADRWYEGNPTLVTSYAVLAIQTAAR
jgi:squalene-hopene/tetraprenyl-beta-curcumene cyclase